MIRGSSFAQGIITGLAKSTARGVQGAMDDFDDRLSRLSEKRLQKMTTEKARFDRDFRENETEIKFLANLLNSNGGKRGMEVLQGIIKKEGGLEGAKLIVPQIVEKINLENTTAEKYFGLPEIKADGSKKRVTAKQIANDITIPISQGIDFDYGTALQGSGMNILNIFANAKNNVADYAKKYVETDLAVSGLDLKSLNQNFGDMPPAPDIKIDRFDLQLGANLSKNLQLVNARLRNTDKTDPSFEKLSNLKSELEIEIENTADKTPTTSILRTTSNTWTGELSKFLKINHRMVNGEYQLLDTKSKNSDLANTYASTLTNYLVMSKASKHRGKLNAPVRGYIPDSQKNNINQLSRELIDYDTPLNAQQFLRTAASNGLNVVFVTKAMINDENGAYYDQDGDFNNGDPYMTVNGVISYDQGEYQNANNTYNKPVNNNPIRNNVSSNTSMNSSAYLAAIKDFQNAPDSGAMARGVKNGMLRFIPNASSLNEDALKELFKKETGIDWKPEFGNIL